MKDIQSKIDKWIEQGKAPVCSCCKKKPVFIPDLANGTDEEGSAWIIGKCYQCLKQDYYKKKNGEGQSFVDFIRNLLANLNGNQKVYFYLEDLRGIDLSNLNLSGTLFLCCDLTLSNFNGANFSNSIFLGSILDNSFLSNSTLEESCLIGCSANFALVESANLSGVVAGVDTNTIEKIKSKAIDEHTGCEETNWFCNALSKWLKDRKEQPCFRARETVLKASNLTNTSFVKCDLTATALDYSRLQGADFSNSYLNDCSFSHVSLGGTFFSGAQLIRADFSDSFTPDPTTVYDIDEAAVYFDEAILTGTFFKNCYFLKASLQKVKAQRVDCRGVVFGPYSELSGDFRNARFDYAEFLGVSLGSKEYPIVLKDCEFPHSFFCGVRIYTADIDTANFARTRFETLESFLSAEENDSKNDTEDARSKLIKKILENYKKWRNKDIYRNSLVGVSADGNFIVPAALNFDSATLGECEVKNIEFRTANFFNVSLVLTKYSKCGFDSCCFDNAYIVMSGYTRKLNSKKFLLLRACSFNNSLIYSSGKYGHANMIFKECVFNATAFEIKRPFKKLDAGHFKFVKCAFELTPLYNYFGKTLGNLVLWKCRFIDGQYIGLFSNGFVDRHKSEIEVFDTIKNIIDNTVNFNDPTEISIVVQEQKKENEEFARKQYLWNMFATNFRRLAIPGLESKCLCELKDLDFFQVPKRRSELKKFKKFNHQGLETISWGTAAWKCGKSFTTILFSSAYVSGYLGNFLPGNEEMVLAFQSIISLFILVCGYWFDYSKNKYIIKALWAKAIYYYGESAQHSLYSWGFVILIFGIFYAVSGIFARNNLFGLCGQFDILTSSGSIFSISNNVFISFIKSLFNCMYFSAVTFTTLGFGDFHPDKLTKLYAALEACIGAVMMALFVLSFARRTAAR